MNPAFVYHVACGAITTLSAAVAYQSRRELTYWQTQYCECREDVHKLEAKAAKEPEGKK
jgi:hypothetical protein